MKIFVGVGDVGSMLNEWSQGFRENGAGAKTAAHSKSLFFPHSTYDIDLSRLNKKLFKADLPFNGYKNKEFFKKGINLTSRFFQSLQIISSFDVFLFVTPELSIFKPDFDYSLIKRLGKKLIVVCVGSDIRHVSGFVQQFPTPETLFDERFKNDNINRPLSNLRRVEKFADIIYSVPDQSTLAIRNYNHFQIPVNINAYECNIPGREIPKVVHAPSRRGIKGTEVILATLDRLADEGLKFDLILLEKVSNRIVKEHLRDADVLVDELVLHGPGILSFEAMCSGCAVATKYLESSPACFRPPVYSINHKNIYDRLKLLLSDQQLRSELAMKGREYAARNNHYSIVSKKILKDLASLETNSIVYDYEASFFKKEYKLPENDILSTRLRKMNTEIARKYWPDFNQFEKSLKERRLI